VLVEIGMAIAEGALSEVGGSLWRRVTAPAPVRAGHRAPTRIQKAASARLGAWLRAEHIDDDDLVVGVQLAVDTLAKAPLPGARELADAGGSPASIVEHWLSRHPLDAPSEAQAAVCARLLEETLAGALLDPEYSQSLILGIVAELALRTPRLAAPALTETHVAMARLRTRDALDLTLSRRPPSSGVVEWDLDDVDIDYHWGEDLLGRIAALQAAAKRGGVSHRLPAPAVDAPNATKLVALRSQRFRDELDALLQGLAESAPGGEPPGVRRDAAWIRAQAANPRYRCCLPISGAWGTGKSDFAAAIASKALARGMPSITVRKGAEGLRAAILAQATEVFGFEFAAIGALESSLQRFDSWTLVVVEDADEWAAADPHFVRELRDVIETTSGRRRLRFAITADSMALDELLDPQDRDFWQRHGFFDPSVSGAARHAVSGWFELDALVVDSRIGLRMLQPALEGDLGALVDLAGTADAPGGAGTRALLCRPRAAMILLTLAALGHRPDVRTEDGFLDEYWNLLSQTIATSKGRRERLEQLIDELAAGFSQRIGDPVAWEGVRDRVFGRRPAIADVDAAEDLLRGLSSAGVVAQAGAVVEARAEIAWGSRIAASSSDLESRSRDELTGLIRPWAHPGATARRALGMYVSRSLFRDAERAGADPRLLLEVWRRLLDADADNAALWLSAMLLDADLQHRLAQRTVRFLSTTASAPEDAFALLYWILHAPEGVWTGDDVLRALEPRYRDVKDSATGVYALRALRSALAKMPMRTRGAREDALALLTRTDLADIGEPAAAVFVERAIADAPSPQQVLVSSVAYLHSRDREVCDELRRTREAGFALGLLYRSIDVVLDATVDQDDGAFAAAADFLLTRDWNEQRGRGRRTRPSAKSADIAYTVVAQSRMSIGYRFRTRPQTVLGYVERLMRGHPSVAELMSAFFVVRHSVATEGRTRLVVDERWRDVLERIAAHAGRYPTKIRDGFVIPLLQANGVPVD